jgi:1-acyl-sn-glycerol-3-phosphate acyltransferase
VVAFGVERRDTGTESLVVVAETRATEATERDRLVAAVTERVAAAVEVPPDEVVLVPPGAVPKTSSGKVRRAATKELFLGGGLGRGVRTSLVSRLRLYAGAAVGELRPRLGRALRALYAGYLALALPLVALLPWLLVWIVPSRRLAFALGRLTVRAGWRLTGCRLTVEGLEHLATPGSFVLASNHASYADVPALMALLPLDFVFVAKRETLSYPIVGTYVRRAGHPTVDRSDAQQSLADAGQATRALAAGSSILFFPEGTFTAATGLRPFRLGAFRTAAEAGVPVLPLALRGTRRALRGDSWLPRPGPIHLWIGAPVRPQGKQWADVVALRDAVAEVIAEHCGEPRLDLVAAGPVRPPS